MKQSNYFIEGAISFSEIDNILKTNADAINIGGHAIFLGQVRADIFNANQTEYIEYTTYNEMAINEFEAVKNTITEKYNHIKFIYILHSLGIVKVGELSLAVVVSAKHRAQAFKALEETVDLIKAKVPIWKREVLNNGEHLWTENSI